MLPTVLVLMSWSFDFEHPVPIFCERPGEMSLLFGFYFSFILVSHIVSTVSTSSVSLLISLLCFCLSVVSCFTLIVSGFLFCFALVFAVMCAVISSSSCVSPAPCGCFWINLCPPLFSTSTLHPATAWHVSLITIIYANNQSLNLQRV